MSCINVHIKDDLGSCLTAIVKRVGNGIKAFTTIRQIHEARVERVDGISIGITLIERLFKTQVFDTIHHPVVRCSIVCSLSEVIDFLNVTPTDVQWITDDMGVYFDVESNVDWIVLTD